MSVKRQLRKKINKFLSLLATNEEEHVKLAKDGMKADDRIKKFTAKTRPTKIK